MFCCKEKIEKQKVYCKGMMIGGIFTAASIIAVLINKKIKCKKNTDKEYELYKDLKDEQMELKEKIDQFNSRRLTVENEAKKNDY